MRNRTEKVTLVRYAVKRVAIVSLTILLLGCSSGGSSGRDTASSNQTVTTEIGTNTNANASNSTNTDTLLVDQPALNWTACEDQRALECAPLLVPLDYSNPNGESISVAMARRAAGRATPARTLMINPGGPGAGGIDALGALVRFGVISSAMTDAFDFVSFDPRGIGASGQVKCNEADVYAQNRYPASREAVEFNFNKLTAFAQSCTTSDGDYIKHLGSFNVVRDINEMRKALGVSQIDFLGYSYGTRLAALYMQTYPQSTGRFVLDGNMKPEPEVAALALGSLSAGQANINTLVDACIGNPVVCSPDQFVLDLQSRVNELVAEPASQEASLVFQILQFAASQPGFEQLVIGALSRYIETQNVEELNVLDTVLGLSESAESDGGLNTTAFVAVMCADDPTRPSVEAIDALRVAFNRESDLLAETQVIVAGMCAGWPASIDPIPQIATNQAPVSLVIGGPSDAQTPLAFAQQMAQAVGGQFLRSEHLGHTTVFTPKNSCTNSAVETFLLTGNLPTFLVCEADVAVSASAPDWLDAMADY